jgi:thermitase
MNATRSPNQESTMPEADPHAAVPAVRRALAVGCVALALATVAAGPATAATDAVPGQLVVGFEKRVSPAGQKAIVERAGGRVLRRLARVRGNVVRVGREGLALKALRGRLTAASGVRYAEPDYYLTASATPDDPLYTTQYPLAPTGAGATGAPTAWTTRTNCAKVAVLDTGTQYSHPDLKSNVWHNPKETAGNGRDDDRNGYVDDYYGVDLVSGSGSGDDDDGHGTHVAGVIGGRGNNATGISGLCWTGSIVPVKFMNARGKGSSSASVEALDYAIASGAKVVNGSFGSSSASTALKDAVTYAQDKGVLLVFAAGNDGKNNDKTPVYPASLTNGNIITVGAVTATGSLASFSNYGAKGVDLGAPGDEILSTYLGSRYKTLSGTSMAAPIVAAAAAMIRAQDSSLSYGSVRSAILSHIRPNAALQGKVARPGVLDVGAALASVR